MGSSCTKPKDINNGHGGGGDSSKSDAFQSFFKATFLLNVWQALFSSEAAVHRCSSK